MKGGEHEPRNSVFCSVPKTYIFLATQPKDLCFFAVLIIGGEWTGEWTGLWKCGECGIDNGKFTGPHNGDPEGTVELEGARRNVCQ